MVIITLKEFAASLLNSGLLYDLAGQTLELAKANNLPLLKLLAPRKDDEMILIFRHSLDKFLNDIIENRAIDHIMNGFQIWQNENHNNPSIEILPADIAIGYTIRKQVLVNKISLFTDCPIQYIQIVEELDALLLIAQKIGFEHLNQQSLKTKKQGV